MMGHVHRRWLLFGAGGWVVATFTLVLLSRVSWSWENWREASCIRERSCLCEALRPGFIRQPSNTWSNLGYLLCACCVLATACADRRSPEEAARRNRMTAAPFYGVAYGLLVLYVGLGSMFFHGSMTFVGQWVDNVSMYALITWVVCYDLARRLGRGKRFLVALWLPANVALAAGAFAYPCARRGIFAFLVLLALYTETMMIRPRLWPGRDRRRFTLDGRRLLAAVLAFGAGSILWILSNDGGPLCAPQSLLQGHAAWHLLSALAAAFLYLYYRSERDPSPLVS